MAVVGQDASAPSPPAPVPIDPPAWPAPAVPTVPIRAAGACAGARAGARAREVTAAADLAAARAAGPGPGRTTGSECGGEPPTASRASSVRNETGAKRPQFPVRLNQIAHMAVAPSAPGGQSKRAGSPITSVPFPAHLFAAAQSGRTIGPWTTALWGRCFAGSSSRAHRSSRSGCETHTCGSVEQDVTVPVNVVPTDAARMDGGVADLVARCQASASDCNVLCLRQVPQAQAAQLKKCELVALDEGGVAVHVVYVPYCVGGRCPTWPGSADGGSPRFESARRLARRLRAPRSGIDRRFRHSGDRAGRAPRAAPADCGSPHGGAGRAPPCARHRPACRAPRLGCRHGFASRAARRATSNRSRSRTPPKVARARPTPR